MVESSNYRVRDARWPDDTVGIRSVRNEVFVREQAVPLDLEWDDHDATCRHVLAELHDGTAIGTGRVLPDGKIGRMAVLASHRGSGVGAALLRRLLEVARETGLARVTLHAQTHAMSFYARHGFAGHGDEFEEAGIPHIEMTLEFDHE